MWDYGAKGKCSLKDFTRALLTERVDFLAGEANQQAVLLLVLGNVFDDVGARLRHGHPLDVCLASQLVDHVALLLQIVGN